MAQDDWTRVFDPRDLDGQPLVLESMPLALALREGRPAYGGFSIRGSDGTRRHLELSAIPLLGQGGRLPGAVAVFWETDAG
jgi:hypothetical protein